MANFEAYAAQILQDLADPIRKFASRQQQQQQQEQAKKKSSKQNKQNPRGDRHGHLFPEPRKIRPNLRHPNTNTMSDSSPTVIPIQTSSSGNNNNIGSNIVFADQRKYTFLWQVRDFNETIRRGPAPLASPTYEVKNAYDVDGKHFPKLLLSMQLQIDESKKFLFMKKEEIRVGLVVKPLSPPKKGLKIKNRMRIRVLDERGASVGKVFHSRKTGRYAFFSHGEYGTADYKPVKYSNLVTIALDLEFKWNVPVRDLESLACQDGAAALSEKLRGLFVSNPKALSDVSLVCDGREFPSHRLLLAASSDVFRAMFEDRNAAVASAAAGGYKIEVHDMSMEALETFLDFLCDQEAVGEDRLRAHSLELYRAAVQYRVPGLRASCRKVIKAQCCQENCVDYAIFGSSNDDDEVLTAATNMLKVNKERVMKSQEWKRMVSEHPLVVESILKKVMEAP